MNNHYYTRGRFSQAGGKETYLPRINQALTSALGVSPTDLTEFSFADVFCGGGSVSLHRKIFGCSALHSNDSGDLNFHLIQALIVNHRQTLHLSSGLDPSDCDDFVSRELCPSVYPSAHGPILDWLTSTARSKDCPIQRGLWMLLGIKYAQSIVGFPTTLGPSNKPLALVIDGQEPLNSLNPKRLQDGSLSKGLQDPSKLLTKLVTTINQSIVSGTGPCYGYQRCAFDFVKHLQVQIAYFDPPYPGTLDYERYHHYLDATLKGYWPDKPTGKNPFTQSVDTFIDLLNECHHIPVWVSSYGNKMVSAEDLGKRIQDIAPKREVFVHAWDAIHMPHVTKSTTNQEILVVAVDRAGL